MTPDEKAKRLTFIRQCAKEQWSGAEIAFELKMTRSGVAGFCQRNGIKLSSKNRGRRAHGEGDRPRVANWRTTQTAFKKPVAKFTVPSITHVVSERSPVSAPKQPPRCMWFACAEPSIAPGKPYCHSHHLQGGGLFHS